ncbi:hypothetical protein LXL04_004849 [Taraxacum kok-saghyz]
MEIKHHIFLFRIHSLRHLYPICTNLSRKSGPQLRTVVIHCTPINSSHINYPVSIRLLFAFNRYSVFICFETKDSIWRFLQGKKFLYIESLCNLQVVHKRQLNQKKRCRHCQVVVDNHCQQLWSELYNTNPPLFCIWFQASNHQFSLSRLNTTASASHTLERT